MTYDPNGPQIDESLRDVIDLLDDKPTREGLRETATRWGRALRDMTSGYAVDPASLLKVFEDGADDYDAMVIVKDIPVYSLCEHHVLPFFGVAHVGYIPDGKIVGLSKISRVVDTLARRLQVQERLTTQIADVLENNLEPLGVGVIIQCRHLCMEARGIRQQGHETLTSALRGALRDQQDTRAEFLKMAQS